MSSILAHGLAAMTAYKVMEKPARLPGGIGGAVLGFGLGLAPDLDVAAMIAFPQFFHHRGWTHSLVFAAALGLVISLIVCFRRWNNLIPCWAGMFLVGCVHPLLDYLMGRGPRVPFFWPFYDQGFLSPVQVVPTAYFSRSVKGLAGLLTHKPTLMGLGLEATIFIPLALLVFYAGLIPGTARRIVFGGGMLLITAAGFFVTITMYN